MKQKNHTSIKTVLPVLFSFFVMGFADVIGISVTYAKEQFGWSETQAGFLPSMVFFWFLVLSVPAAMLTAKAGRKNTVLISMILTFVGMIIPFIRFDEITCYFAFMLMGMGNTIMQVSINPLLSNVVSANMFTSRMVTGHFIKAISSFLGPILAGFCSLHFGRWELIFPMYAAICFISTTWLYFTYIERETMSPKPSSFAQTWALVRENRILLLFLGIVCVVGLDVGMNIVTPKLLIERLGMEKEAAGYGTSWYFAARTVGTFCGAFLLAKISEKIYFRVNMVITSVAIAGLMIVQTQAAILSLVCIIAFCASCIFAVIISAAVRAKPGKTDEISGLMITGIAGAAVIPILMGMMTDAVGTQNGSIIIIAGCTAYLLFCSLKTWGKNDEIKTSKI